MRALHRTILVLFFLFAAACELDEGKRCDEGQVFEDGFCVAGEEDDTAGENPYADSGIDGLGEPCTTDAACAGTEALYCAVVPGAAAGNCAIRDCDPDDDQCPLDLICCDFPPDGLTAGVPDLCIPPAEYDSYDALGMCDG